MACPYAAAENDQSRYSRRLGIIRMLDWLETQPGATWQDRWHAGAGPQRIRTGGTSPSWRLKAAGRIAAGNQSDGAASAAPWAC